MTSGRRNAKWALDEEDAVQLIRVCAVAKPAVAQAEVASRWPSHEITCRYDTNPETERIEAELAARGASRWPDPQQTHETGPWQRRPPSVEEARA